MTTTQIINSKNETEVRQMAIAFATANNYNVSDMYNQVDSAWFALMTEIHANGKEGNYEAAKMLGVAKETLQAWA